MNFRYAKEKLSGTIQYLATAPGDARDRMSKAYLGFHTLKGDDFPEPLRKRWTWVMAQMTKYGPYFNPYDKGHLITGSVEHTMSRIKNKTAAKIAKEIFDLNWELENNY